MFCYFGPMDETLSFPLYEAFVFTPGGSTYRYGTQGFDDLRSAREYLKRMLNGEIWRRNGAVGCIMKCGDEVDLTPVYVWADNYVVKEDEVPNWIQEGF